MEAMLSANLRLYDWVAESVGKWMRKVDERIGWRKVVRKLFGADIAL